MSNSTFAAGAPTEALESAYNLFRNKERPEILCAVPEDRTVPAFITAREWEYVRKLDTRSDLPPGFHRRGARAGVRYNGFYLFQRTADETAAAGEDGGDGAESDPARQCVPAGARTVGERAGRVEGRSPNVQTEHASLLLMTSSVRSHQRRCA